MRTSSLLTRVHVERKDITPFFLTLSCLVIMVLLVWDNAPQEAPFERAASRVQVVPLNAATENAIISGYGTVEPSKALDITPQVGGVVIRLNPKFEIGGRFEKGEFILQVDPRDYEIQLDAIKANLLSVESSLKQEEGNHEVARREWELFSKGNELVKEKSELALRIPMLKERQAAFQSAESQVRKAQLDLERTKLFAPFPCLVLSEKVEESAYVFQSFPIASIAATDMFYVKVNIPENALQWLPFGSSENTSEQPPQEAMSVKVIPQNSVGGAGVRAGKLERLLGSVDTTGRTVQLLVSVPNPLEVSDTALPLLIGAYVKVEIAGKRIAEIYKIPRRLMREQNGVLVADAARRLRTRAPEVVFTRDEYVYVRGGFQPGDSLIVSSMAAPLEGIKLELETLQEQP